MQRATRQSLRGILWQLAFWLFQPVVALLVLRFYWGYHAADRLARLRPALHAQGLKVYPTDFPDYNSVPEKDNAVAALIKAMSDFRTVTGSIPRLTLRTNNQGKLDLERTRAETLDITAAYRSAARSIQDIDDAATRRFTIWPQPIKPGGGNWATREFDQVLCNMALVELSQGKDANALHDLRRVLTIVRIRAESPDYATYALGLVDAKLAEQVLEELSLVLYLVESPANAEAKQVLQLLKDEGPNHAYSRQGLLTQMFENTPEVKEWTRWAFNPFEIEQLARQLQYVGYEISALGQPDYPHAKAVLTSLAAGKPTTNLARIVNTLPLGVIGDGIYRDLAYRRAVSILLAAKLFQATHKAYPDSVDELVPEYFSAVPRDPYHAANQPLLYRRTVNGPLVWSVGENGSDETTGGVTRGKSDDLWFGADHNPRGLP